MAGLDLNVDIDSGDLQRAYLMLGDVKDAVPKVKTRAINRVLSGVVTDAVKEIRTVITPTAKVIKATFTTKKASIASSSALVKSTGKPLGLIHYKANATNKGVTVQIKKGNRRTLFQGAVIATMKSGHKGVFSREKPPYRSKASSSLPWAKFGKKYRLPIHEKFGPRVPDILSNPPIYEAVEKKACVRLHKRIIHEIDYELSRLE